GHLYLEDSAGERILDMNPDRKETVSLLVPARRPLYFKIKSDNREFVLDKKGNYHLTENANWKTSSIFSRGAEHEAFTQLFNIPFAENSVSAFEKDLTASIEESIRNPPLDPLRTGAGISALLFLSSGIWFNVMAHNEHSKINDQSSEADADTARRRIRADNSNAALCYGISALSAIAYFTWDMWGESSWSVTIVPNVVEPGLAIKKRF
ncbi:MAG: hypothetical protein HQK54_14350, partial [Oligoflexales bacterium]|nr:hypothetical protein [Oligoflexales bacterium]